MSTTRISANISGATHEQLERFVRTRGMKKGFVIEQALLHHLRASHELPEDAVIPPRLVIDHDSGLRVMERLQAGEQPSPAMEALFDGHGDGSEVC
jgi:hypothetical protein